MELAQFAKRQRADDDDGGRVQRISAQAVQRICSDQVIIDLQSALKELIENALDAGASKIDVRLKEHGVELLEVADNGKGIPVASRAGVALRHHTSKLEEFDDLQRLRSFGFRGEALNSLATLATLSISTRTKDDATGALLTFGADGGVAKSAPVARDTGTAVSVAQLFGPFPVRRRELQRNATNEFRKMLATTQTYAIICDSVRFTCVNQLAKGGRQVALQTEGGRGGGGGMRASIASIFGAKQVSELQPFASTSLPGSGEGEGEGAVASPFEVEGFISRPREGSGRRTGDRQYVYVNRRPVDFPRLTRLMNEAFRSATAKSECFPVAFLNVTAPPDSFDINVSPDKRVVMFADEAALLALVRRMLEQLFAAEACSFGVQPVLSFARAAAPAGEPAAALAAAPAAAAPPAALLAVAPAEPHAAAAEEEEAAAAEEEEAAAEEQEEGGAVAGAEDDAIVLEDDDQQKVIDHVVASITMLDDDEGEATAEEVGAAEPMSADSEAEGGARAGRKRKAERGHAEAETTARARRAGRIVGEGAADPAVRSEEAQLPGIARAPTDSDGEQSETDVDEVEGETEAEEEREAEAEAEAAAKAAAKGGEAGSRSGGQAEGGAPRNMGATSTSRTAVRPAASGGRSATRGGDASSAPRATSSAAASAASSAPTTAQGETRAHPAAGARASSARHGARGGGASSGAGSGAGSGSGGGAEGSDSGSAQLASEVAGGAAASAAAGTEGCVEVDVEGGAEGGAGCCAEGGAEGCAEQSAEQSVSAPGMFELLRSVQQECDEQGLGPEDFLLMACRTLAQQIGALPAAGEAGETADAADAAERLRELTLCGTRFVQGWLMQNAAPRNLPEVQVQMTLATCGWDWEASDFEEGGAAMPSTVADAFARLAELIEQPQPQPRRLIERPNRRARGAAAPAAAATAAVPDSAQEAPALPSRAVAPNVTLEFSMAAFSREYARATPRAPPARAQPPGATLADAAAAGGGGGGGGEARLNSVPDAGCLDRATRVAASELEGELRRVLPRESFLRMEPLGQFNLGFIICRSGADLFIVDQHAADEKHRFETLQASTEIHTQRLIAPLPLSLTAADELTVLDHLHVFRRNGFEIQVVEGAPPTQRLRLLALPFSKHTVFGPSDVHELVTLLAEAPGQDVSLPKLRSMFAMRACRSAVMIGTALEHSKMKQIVSQLARLDQPWNCPHGRPTLRHLVSLNDLAQQPASRAFGGGGAL